LAPQSFQPYAEANLPFFIFIFLFVFLSFLFAVEHKTDFILNTSNRRAAHASTRLMLAESGTLDMKRRPVSRSVQSQRRREVSTYTRKGELLSKRVDIGGELLEGLPRLALAFGDNLDKVLQELGASLLLRLKLQDRGGVDQYQTGGTKRRDAKLTAI
jgi:hypothetical protein